MRDKLNINDFQTTLRDAMKQKAEDLYVRKEFDKMERMIEALRQQCTVVTSECEQTKKEVDQLS